MTERMAGGDEVRAPREPRSARGRVYLVGAGPGRADLLTRRAAKLLRRADVVVHDSLVGEEILELVRPDAHRIDVGKRPGKRCGPSQEEINGILVEAAANTRVVVRLKGGDPFVFGRGGEEALALRAAGVRFEVVPGITAALGVSAYAGIPLTHRDVSSSVVLVTGHEGSGPSGRVDWELLARSESTLAIYMGVATLESIAQRLIDGGRSPLTPAAVVEWGTRRSQRTITAPLAEIASAARIAAIGAPALVVVGEVAALHDRLGWFDRAPLRGVRILVARSRAEPSRLLRRFLALGADAREFPRLRAEPTQLDGSTDAAVATPGAYDWAIFTSTAAVAHFWNGLLARGLDARAFGGVRIAALGHSTAVALSRRGIVPDVATRTYVPARVAALLDARGGLAGKRVLFPREMGDTSPIAAELARAGAIVREAEIFTLVEDRRRAPVRGGFSSPEDADVIVLPSSSCARRIAAELNGRAVGARVVAIGPRTADAAIAAGLPVDAIADDHSVPGLVRTVRSLVGIEPAGSPERPLEVLTVASP